MYTARKLLVMYMFRQWKKDILPETQLTPELDVNKLGGEGGRPQQWLDITTLTSKYKAIGILKQPRAGTIKYHFKPRLTVGIPCSNLESCDQAFI